VREKKIKTIATTNNVHSSHEVKAYFIPPSSSAVGEFSTYYRCFGVTLAEGTRALSPHMSAKCARALRSQEGGL